MPGVPQCCTAKGYAASGSGVRQNRLISPPGFGFIKSVVCHVEGFLGAQWGFRTFAYKDAAQRNGNYGIGVSRMGNGKPLNNAAQMFHEG